MVGAVIPAAGAGVRMGEKRAKQFRKLCGRTILAHTLKKFEDCKSIDRVVVVAPKGYVELCRDEVGLGFGKVSKVVTGGRQRQDSVYEGLKVLEKDIDIVVVHDAVRPFIEPDLIDKAVELCKDAGAVIVAVRAVDTVKFCRDKVVECTLDRESLWCAQTPQVFERTILERAFERALEDGFYGTDEAALVERLGHGVGIVEGSYDNIKITTPEDMEVGKLILGRMESANRTGAPNLRIGHGFDVHRLQDDRKLILGGVQIPFAMGLLGHSDGDVLCHAIADSLLGAAALGDIGRHFPDSDPEFEGISSLIILESVRKILDDRGFCIVNVDSTIVAQRPKVSKFISQMRKNIADALGIDKDRISVKATTTEGLGYTGRGEGIGAYAVSTVHHSLKD